MKQIGLFFMHHFKGFLTAVTSPLAIVVNVCKQSYSFSHSKKYALRDL